MAKFLPYLLIVVALLLSRCAQQTAITGGERDRTPPQIDSNKVVSPPNGTINFSADRIVIPFNEYVTFKNKDKEILITPFLETAPDIYVKGKKVIVDFEAPLDDNTTYIINFGKSIVDNTEGNQMVNYKYVFSTGSYIDSLKYQIAVYDSYSKTPVEGAYVMLYKNHNDSIILKEKPNYFGISDSKGLCTIENIASGSYKVVAFMEENSNYLWDPRSEKIGYLEKKFNAAKDTLTDTLILFSNYKEEIEILDGAVTSSGKGFIAFNKPLDHTYNIEKDSLIGTYAEPKTAILNANRDSLHFFIRYDLEKGEKYNFGIETEGKKIMVPMALDTSLTLKTNGTNGLKPNTDYDILFSQVIVNTDPEKMELFNEEKSIPFSVVQTGVSRITIEAEWEEDEDYELHLFPGAIASYMGLSNDSIISLFSTLEENDFGNLTTSFKVAKSNYIVELLSEGKVKYRDYPSGNEFSRTYTHLTPGTYRIRLIFDDNANKVWDTGNYFDHQAPERVEYYSEPIKVKKGWDMEINWEIVD